MRLEKMVIKDYKSIVDLEWDLIEPMTCLVGQNESGKSNLLDVFRFLDIEKVKDLNFETHTRRSSQRYMRQQIPQLSYYFKLYPTDKKLLVRLFAELGVKIRGPEMFGFVFTIKTTKDTSNLDGHIQLTQNRSYSFDSMKHLTVDTKAKLFKDILRLNGAVVYIQNNFNPTYLMSVEDISKKDKEKSPIFQLLEIAGVTDLQNFPQQRNQIRQYLRMVNKSLNRNFVKKYYRQDEAIRFEFTHESGLISLEIEDNTDAPYSMEERSDGFKYFFGLLISMAAYNSADAILILDEPGQSLHPSGQRDLLAYLEIMSLKNRIIYSTHSPFMIDRLYPNRVKIVHRDDKKGTIFKYKGFSKNWKPLRSSIGLNIKDSFYYSDKALIVEGAEDLIYISSLINYFNRTEQVKLTTDLFSFIDAGSESNLPSMVQIILDDDRPTLVLIDSDSTSTFNKLDKKVKQVNNKEILDLIQINEFKKKAISIEDLLPNQLLINASLNYANELVEDGVLEKITGAPDLSLNFTMDSNSRYKDYVAPKIKEVYKEVDIELKEWDGKKTPLSKVGIARHFELLLTEDNRSLEKMNFEPSLKLVKTIAKKLRLEKKSDNK